MSEQRDELADILMSEEVMKTDGYGRDYALAEADAILAAGYRRVNTRDEATVERVAQAINATHDYSHLLPWSHLVQSKDKANRDRVARDRAYARAVLAAMEGHNE